MHWNLEDVFIVCRHVYVLMQCNLSHDLQFMLRSQSVSMVDSILYAKKRQRDDQTKKKICQGNHTTRKEVAR